MWSQAPFNYRPTILAFAISWMVLLGMGHLAEAQSRPVSIGASVINTDFSSSTASVIDVQDRTFLVTFRVKNTGELTSKDTMLSLVMPVGWGYKETSGTVDQVLVQDRAYGQLMELALSPIGKNQTKEVGIYLERQKNTQDGTLFAAITSQYSQPIYSKLSPETETQPSSFWASWLRSTGEYLWMTFGEIWSRFLLAVRYTAS